MPLEGEYAPSPQAWVREQQKDPLPPPLASSPRGPAGAGRLQHPRREERHREFDPDAVRRLKAGSDADLLVGGAELAGAALRAGLVDEVRLFLFRVLVGGGRPAWGEDVRARLELREERRFGSGVVHLGYDVAGS